MKSRRRIASPKARDQAPYQVNLAMSALGQERHRHQADPFHRRLKLLSLGLYDSAQPSGDNDG